MGVTVAPVQDTGLIFIVLLFLFQSYLFLPFNSFRACSAVYIDAGCFC